MSELIDSATKKVGTALIQIKEAIGALEMANREDDRALLTGYTGNSAIKALRESARGIELAKERLDALSPMAVGR